MRQRSWLTILIFTMIFIFGASSGFAQYKNEAEMKKAAEASFDDEDYETGYKLYSQLVSNYPKDPNYNYRLGVCMLFNEPDKKKCFSYLEFANSRIKDCEKEVVFYLGKANHINFRFDEAIKYYTQYKGIASSSMVKKLQVDHEIQACKNGKRLLSELSELIVIDKKQLTKAEYFRSYDLSGIGGKLLVKPSEFYSSVDKKKKNKSIIYLPKSNDQCYYASYGDNDKNGKDIYIVRKLPNGNWGKPENMGSPINTEYDEDYPFLHPNGKVFYFASKGHNSMGGYDIFKSELDENTRRWKEPVNMEFPINTPDDEILFVTDSLDKIAYFSSTRSSPAGKIDVYKINTERRAMDFAFLKGTVLKKDPMQSVRSRIKVKNISTGEDVGTYDAKDNGEYAIQLPNGGNFIFTVETPGFQTQSEGVKIPPAYNTLKPYKQLISYEKEKLVIQNLFDETPDAENAYLQYIDLIEQKAKLEVNADDFVNTPVLNNKTNTNNTPKDTISTANNSKDPIKNNSGNNLNNSELIKIANEDAKEADTESKKLKNDANDASTFANNKAVEAAEKSKAANLAEENASKETDPTKKEELKSTAEKLKDEASTLNIQATTASNIAKQLDNDAETKKQEADLSSKYAKELEDANKTKNNKEALAKLEKMQKELADLSQKKSQTNELANTIKIEADRKSEELAKTEAKSDILKKEADDIKNEINNLDKEIAGTSDKTLVENYKGQQEELKTDLANKNKEIESNKTKVDVLKKESESLKSQADFTNNMITAVKNDEPLSNLNNSTVTTNTTTVSSTQNDTNNTKTNIPQFTTDAQKYDKQLSVLDGNSETIGNYEQKNLILDHYIKEIDKEIVAKKDQLKKAKSNEKTSINKEIKDLEARKKEKNEKIKENDKKVVELNKAHALASEIHNNNNEDTSKTNSTAVNETKTDNSVTTNTVTPDNKTDNTNTTVTTNTVTPDNKTDNTNTTVTTNTVTPDNKTDNTNTTVTTNTVTPDNKTDNTNTTVTTNTVTPDNKIDNSTTNNTVASNADKIKEELDALKNKNQPEKTSNENKLFNGVIYTDPKSITLKKEAEKKYNETTKSEKDLNAKINSFQGNLNSNSATGNLTEQSIADRNSSADSLGDEAFKYRKTMATLTGPEKEDALNKAVELEKKAAEVRLQAAEDQSQMHQTQLSNNKTNLEELSKLSDKKNIDDIVKAQALFAEAKTYMENAKKLKEEANAETSPAAKVGALANVDEKERLALFKQEQALNLFKKYNPSYQIKTASNDNVAANASNKTKLNEVKAELDKTEKTRNSALKTLTDANKAEYNALLVKLNQLEKTKPNANPEIKTFKSKGQKSVVEANGLIIKSNNSKNDEEVRQLLTDANQKLEEAISDLAQAIQLLGPTDIAVNTNNTNATGNDTTKTNNSNTTGNSTDGALTVEQIKEVKNTPEYKNYIGLKAESDKLNETASLEENKAKPFYEKAGKELKESNDIRIKADAMPDGTDKINMRRKARELDRMANLNKTKGDSINGLASNTKAQAQSKKTEADLFIQNLDKQTYNNILAATGNNNAGTNTTNNANPKYVGFSSTYQNNATQFDKELKSFEPEGDNQANLKDQNIVLKNYVKAMNIELTGLKKKLTPKLTGDERKKVNEQIKNLEAQRFEKDQMLKTNEVKIEALNPKVNTDITNNTPNNNTGTNTNNAAEVKGNDIAIKKTDAYSVNNPIPVDVKLPEGFIFRVQIGAFRNPIQPNTFKGLTPIAGETTPQGLIRYQVGFFTAFEKANGVKNDMKKLGYSDAFVTVYFNGKRLTLEEALELLKKQGTNVSVNPNETAGITTNSNVPTKNEIDNSNRPTNNVPNGVVNVSELNNVSGMLFTVQIGVYSSQANSAQLFNLKPIYREKLPNGYYRYTAGIYNSIDKVKIDKSKVNSLGISDAFVTAYINGERVKVPDALTKLGSGTQVNFPPENPIQFGNTSNNVTPNTTTVNNTNPVTPFSNGVNTDPVPTNENGVKAGDAGITFKVQIGAFRNQVPEAVANNFMKIKSWPIKYMKVNELFVYIMGSYIDAKSAKKLQEEAISNGIGDAFIVVFKDGKKLSGEEARKYFNP